MLPFTKGAAQLCQCVPMHSIEIDGPIHSGHLINHRRFPKLSGLCIDNEMIINCSRDCAFETSCHFFSFVTELKASRFWKLLWHHDLETCTILFYLVDCGDPLITSKVVCFFDLIYIIVRLVISWRYERAMWALTKEYIAMAFYKRSKT